VTDKNDDRTGGYTPKDSESNSSFSGEPGIVSRGESPTRVDDVFGQFLGPNQELPPELLSEQKAVLLRMGDLVADRFEVVAILGFGGMGAVYRVRDRHLDGDKALKVMLPSLFKSETARQRFLDEVAISQKLSHEGIVRVHDLGVDQKRKFYFFTMEFVEGNTLHRVLQERGGKLTVQKAQDITHQLCDALEYAHRYTIHRDLKPQNVMVQPDGRIKILDFGLAKLMSPGRLTKSSMALGTAYYQAPEQSIHLTELDQRADIYSIGVMLYQMLTGEIPVGRFKIPSAITRGIPQTVDEAVLKCLEPKPEERPATVAELREALHGACASPSWSGRRIVPLVLVVATLLAVVGSIYWLMRGPGPTSVPGEPGPSPMTQAPETTTPAQEPNPEPGPSTTAQAPETTTQATEPSPEPAPPPPLAAPEQKTSPAEVSASRRAALDAQTKAKQAGAEQYAYTELAAADQILKEAEFHGTLKHYDAAKEGYAVAIQRYGEATAVASRVAAEFKACLLYTSRCV